MLGSPTAYLLVLPWAGLMLATVAFAGGLTCWLGSRWWTRLIAAGILAAVVRIVFEVLFQVQLPDGNIELAFIN